MGALLAALVLAMEIHASGDCPGAAQVQRQLEPLLGEPAAAGMSDVATIKRERDGSLSVSLADAAGRDIGGGDRRLPRARSCGDQAETVAVTLAVWEAQLHPEISLRLDRLSPEAAPPPPPVPAPAAMLIRPASAAAGSRHAVGTLGVAAVGDSQSSVWAPGARVELSLGRADARWRLRIAVVGVGRHTVDLPPGQATWWRAFLVVGAEVDVARGRRWAAVLGAGAVGGVDSISGTGFAVDHDTRSLDAGGEASARLEWRPGRLHPWLGASVVGWARRQALDVQGVSPGSALPRLEPMAALGADFVW